MIAEKITALEQKFQLLSVELGRGMFGLYSEDEKDRRGIAINIDRYSMSGGWLGLTKCEARQLYQALGSMMELMGWEEA